MSYEPIPALSLLALASSLALLTACGEDDILLPYGDDETVVINADPTTDTVISSTPDGDACVEIPSGECIRPQDECGDAAHADVLLDGEGSVIEIVCYPVAGETVIIEAEDGNASVGSNGAVVILGDDDIDGDLTIEGNRGVVFGDLPDGTVIEGDLNLRGNQSTVRGVRVRGNVNFDGNDARLFYCVVEGDVHLSGNANLVSNCTVFGSILGSGNEDRIISNFVRGEITVGGPPRECRDNKRFTDTDADLVLDQAEIGSANALDCMRR